MNNSEDIALMQIQQGLMMETVTNQGAQVYLNL